MEYIVAIPMAIICGILAVLYEADRYKAKEATGIWLQIRTNPRFALVTGIVYIGVSVLGMWMYSRQENWSIGLYRWLLLIFALYLIAWVDLQEKIIPNRLIVVMLLIRIGFLVFELCLVPDMVELALLPAGIGLLIGGGVFLVAALVSRSGVGMGDVKLFAVIGAYVGSVAILPVLFAAVLFSALTGVAKIIFCKAKVRDTMAMAPFALIGVVTYFLLGFFGG